MAKRDKYLRKFNRTKNLDLEYLYKKFKNKVVSEIHGSKNDYYEQYFTKHKSNMKMLWSGIHSIINCKSNVGSNISCLHHSDGIKLMTLKKWQTYSVMHLLILLTKLMKKFATLESHH